jgi:hypothetical protein
VAKWIDPNFSLLEALVANSIWCSRLKKPWRILCESCPLSKSYFNPRIVQKVKLGANDYDYLPNFTFLEEPSGAVAQRIVIGLFGLLIPTLLVGWVGLLALRRYPLAG